LSNAPATAPARSHRGRARHWNACCSA